jgi:hypothetical protein
MIRFIWSLFDLHFTRHDCTLSLSVKITTLRPFKMSLNECNATATAKPSSSKIIVSWSFLLMRSTRAGDTTSLKQPTHFPLKSKATPEWPSGSNAASTYTCTQSLKLTSTGRGTFASRSSQVLIEMRPSHWTGV